MSKITLLILAGSCYCHIIMVISLKLYNFHRGMYFTMLLLCVCLGFDMHCQDIVLFRLSILRDFKSFILHGCFWIVVKVSVSLIGFYSKHWNCMCKLPFYSLFLNIYFLFMVVLVTEKLVLHTFLYRYNTSSLQIVCVLFVCIVTEKLKTYFDTDSFLS